ncbi:MAG: hypothetical protein M1813_004347 [Trichoglossum hirsutum]|nr:MAG: hypothetical protein M1813_004347 [Trichoglossum hirsutum]
MSFAVFCNLFGEKRTITQETALILKLAGIPMQFVPSLTKGLGHASAANPTGQSRTLALFAGQTISTDFSSILTNPCDLGLNVLASILIFFLVPETAGAMLSTKQGCLNYTSLEELNYNFGVRTWKHIEYQLKTVVPWAQKYYMRRRPTDRQSNTSKLLYTWVRIQKEIHQQNS